MKQTFIEEIDVLKYISEPNFMNQELKAYTKGFDFLSSRSTFQKLSSWVEKTDTFTKLLLHSKFSTSDEV